MCCALVDVVFRELSLLAADQCCLDEIVANTIPFFVVLALSLELTFEELVIIVQILLFENSLFLKMCVCETAILTIIDLLSLSRRLQRHLLSRRDAADRAALVLTFSLPPRRSFCARRDLLVSLAATSFQPPCPLILSLRGTSG
jgi:hypothetical protein